MEEQRPFLSPNEYAHLLGLSVSKVYKMLRKGELPHVRIGSAYRIHRDTVKRYVEVATQPPKKGRDLS
jgi:excisionase family DNA binding protein